jgi:methionine biosynthesis protein MetW
MPHATSTVAAYTGPRPDVVALIDTAPRRVLDIGCSDGSLGASLRSEGTEVVGIEYDSAFAATAREQLDRVVVGDAEEAAKALIEANETFDLVICADVLEHIVNPGAVLWNVHRLLTPPGKCIVSLPNVRFWTTFTQLGLHGRWPRKDRGLHDRTHVSWFTDRDARDLFTHTGFAVEFAARNMRLFDDPFRKGNGLARYLDVGPLRPFLTYQNLYRLAVLTR